MSVDFIAVGEKSPREIVADWISSVKFTGVVLRSLMTKKFVVDKHVLEAIKKDKSILQTDEGWDAVCDLVSKKSILPYAKDRCTGKAYIGEYGNALLIGLRRETGIEYKPPSTTTLLKDRLKTGK